MIWPVSCWLEENSTDVDQLLETQYYLPYMFEFLEWKEVYCHVMSKWHMLACEMK